MSAALYWFRNDLRLHDNPALVQACAQSGALLPVFCLGSVSAVHNGDARGGVLPASPHRQRVLLDSLIDLDAQLRALGSALAVVSGSPADVLPQLGAALGTITVHCETIAAPYEQNELDQLRQAGMEVSSRWQSSLYAPETLPFALGAWAAERSAQVKGGARRAGDTQQNALPPRLLAELPPVYSRFRQLLAKAGTRPVAPLPSPARLPPLPQAVHDCATVNLAQQLHSLGSPAPDPRASLPYLDRAFAGGERAALAHLVRYFASDLPPHYKVTRNGLTGIDFSSKCSMWLATGALSVRQLAAAIDRFDARHGPNEGTEWLRLELLWRDYFRFLHLQHGAKLFRYRGLRDTLPARPHDPVQFSRWCQGLTPEPLVNAAMHELLATGYLSNRLRQVVASYWIHDLQGDWRAGAAWFEAQLIDYDVYNNQGNWLYIAGMGTDPRGGRRFNVQKQAQDHDPDQSYQRLWQQA
jgi:deoxyribodipyrimidine photo-lyase